MTSDYYDTAVVCFPATEPKLLRKRRRNTLAAWYYAGKKLIHTCLRRCVRVLVMHTNLSYASTRVQG